ncbi:MAG: hypothetical protein U5R31_15370 [Acidimicrobiia bacterium]|nr:hypothetical protein [Acidimicrobiia bacterium]
MTTVEIPEDAARRLQAEAGRRGISVDDVVVEFASRLPAEAPGAGRRLSFIGVGASGDTRPLDIHRERAELAERKLPTATLRRLEAEATRCGVGVDVVIAELAEALPADDTTTEAPTPRRKFALAGIGASGGDRFARDADELLAGGFGRD